MARAGRILTPVVVLALVAASGCFREELGPLEVTIVTWEPSLDAKNLTIVIRIVNTGDEPIWRLDISPHINYLTENATFHGYRDDPRGFASFVAGIWVKEEVLTPHSYSERSAYFHFDEPRNGTPPPREPPLPRYQPTFSLEYETPTRGWRFNYFMCDRLPSGEEVKVSTCRDPWFEFEHDTQGRPPNAVEIGEPLA